MITVLIKEPTMRINGDNTPVKTFECPHCKIDILYFVAPPANCGLCKKDIPNVNHLFNYPLKRIQWHMGDTEL